jgi:Cu(I)/Ag(I) efflux system membrane fusion protein
MSDEHKSTGSRQDAPSANNPSPVVAQDRAVEPNPKTPGGPRLQTILLVVAVVAMVFWLGSAVGGPVFGAGHKLWHSIFGHRPEQTTAGATTQYYTCGMHPWVILPKPGNCPICGMTLVPLDSAKFTGQVTINPVVAQDIGIRLSPVISGPVTRMIRTVGTVTYDETRVRDVNIKVGGWIEKLFVDYLGAPVTKGQPLFDLYSPDLYVAQEEYLQAWKNRGKDGSDDVLKSTRKKLEYFDITPEQIKELEQRGKQTKTVAILSPYAGVAIAKQAVEGMKVTAGAQVYRIADLSKIWVMVTVYEYQLPYVQLGQNATMNLTYLPGQQFAGKVIYIYPYLNDKTRQVDIRLEFDNANGLLKPGMYANVDLHSTLAKDRTLAPRSAIIDTGERKVAFVSLGDGRFEPRNIQTGAEAQNGMVEVLDGLKPGEEVVTSGQFLIDSEANVREALAKMIKGNLSSDQKVSVASTGRGELAALPEATAKSLQSIVTDYLQIQGKLAADSIQDLATPANGIAHEVDSIIKIEIPEAPHFWHTHDEAATIRGKALELATAKSLDQARVTFADLSIALGKLLKGTGVPKSFGREVQELHCPMYRQGQGGTVWLQTAGAVSNPYFGTVMPGCFDQRKALPVTGQVPSSSEAPAGEKKGPVTPVAPRTTNTVLNAVQQKHVDTLSLKYLKVQALLAGDQFESIPALLKDIHEAAMSLGSDSTPTITTQAKLLMEASMVKPVNLEEARLAFKPISDAVIALLKLAPQSPTVAGTLYQIHCPMTKGNWLQTNDKIANPYYGKEMPTCGELVGKIGAAETK